MAGQMQLPVQGDEEEMCVNWAHGGYCGTRDTSQEITLSKERELPHAKLSPSVKCHSEAYTANLMKLSYE